MIIYSGKLSTFHEDVFNGLIANKLEKLFEENNIVGGALNEFRSWNNSLEVISTTLEHAHVDPNLDVAVEYQIPLTSKRVDFLLAGLNAKDIETVMAIELKQWDYAETTVLENCVKTFVGGANRVVAHPSQQVLSYCQLISNFNASIQEDAIRLVPCAFLHNYSIEERGILEDSRYQEVVKEAPLFYKQERQKLGSFIKENIAKPAKRNLFEVVDNGKLRPSKALQDSILGLIDGNEHFTMVDEQQVAYATIYNLVSTKLKTGSKYTVIVRGGPGTGKSVIAIQTMCNLIKKGYAAIYMTKNAAPHQVFSIRLTEGHKTQKFIKGLFMSPVVLEKETMVNKYPCILVDEGHRLTTRYGHNQIEDIIRSGQITVFFIDEDQRVTTKDIGTAENIKAIAAKYGSRIIEDDALNLVSQFRCNGSDGYLALLDRVLGIRDTANTSLDGLDYEVRVFDSPVEMRNKLRELNEINNKSRMLAGYCYEWVSEHNPELYDIFLKDGFKAQWNFRDGAPFAIADTSFEQVGCIHTCQGLEFDYVGVIVGKDLRYENGKVITDQTKIAKSDKSSNIKTCRDAAFADRLIRNTYKTLMSRGQKGCYIYCEDEELRNYFKKVFVSSNLIKNDF